MYQSKRSDGTPRYSTLQMMSISGHTDEKTFEEYIKLSPMDVRESEAVIINWNVFDMIKLRTVHFFFCIDMIEFNEF